MWRSRAQTEARTHARVDGYLAHYPSIRAGDLRWRNTLIQFSTIKKAAVRSNLSCVSLWRARTTSWATKLPSYFGLDNDTQSTALLRVSMCNFPISKKRKKRSGADSRGFRPNSVSCVISRPNYMRGGILSPSFNQQVAVIRRTYMITALLNLSHSHGKRCSRG